MYELSRIKAIEYPPITLTEFRTCILLCGASWKGLGKTIHKTTGRLEMHDGRGMLKLLCYVQVVPLGKKLLPNGFLEYSCTWCRDFKELHF